VLGTQSSLPSRYNVGSGWGRRWPHTIDPSAFYDEQGKLWLVYGSWSGGIWMLELDEETGLRDYDVTYAENSTSDPYFGKKISGGYYSSGEASYIEYIGGYYFLFVTNGQLVESGIQRSQQLVIVVVDADGTILVELDGRQLARSVNLRIGVGARNLDDLGLNGDSGKQGHQCE
jgi:hypothetical protein